MKTALIWGAGGGIGRAITRQLANDSWQILAAGHNLNSFSDLTGQVYDVIHGKVVRLSDSSGKVRLIDFWATWCAPCVEAIPHYRELHNELKDQGLVVIGISMDEGGADLVRPFAEKHQMTYTSSTRQPADRRELRTFCLPDDLSGRRPGDDRADVGGARPQEGAGGESQDSPGPGHAFVNRFLGLSLFAFVDYRRAL